MFSIPIDKVEATKLIRESGGRVFTVGHKKKDGTLRLTNARLNVKKGVKGVGLKYNPSEKGLIPVYDMQIQAHRMVNTETLSSLRIDGKYFEIY